MGIFLAPGANAVEVANAVEKRLEELSKNFPPDIKYEIAYNPVEFVEAAIKEVIRTLIEAIILVIIVTLFFLGRTRATAIPVLAIPVSIIGAFAGLYLLGFSINLLTLFALILAVGLVVDDAIIVVENIERIIREEKLSPKEAAIKSMEEITPALIAIVIVLASVFIPPAFTGGFTGEMFKQFAATIAITMILSGLVALTLTPVLSAIFLKEEKKKMFIIFRGFGKLIEGFRWFFLKSVKVILKIWPISFVVLAGVSFAIFYLDKKLPSSLVPVEDKGSLFFITYSMPGSSLDTTEKNVKFVENLLSKDPVFHDYLSIIGLDFGAFAFKTDAANTFAHPIHWDKRDPKTQSTMALAKKYFKLVSQYRDALIFPVNPPPIMGLSTTGGFEVYIQDRTGGNIFKLSQIVNEFINEVNQRPELIGVRTTLNTIAPQYKIVVDRDKAESLGVNVDDVYTTIQMVFGKAYVNDFNLFGKVFHVNIGSLENYRNNIDDLRYIYVRSKNGDLIPVSSLIKESDRTATSLLFERFNMFPAAKIMGQASPGYSSGQALQALEEVAKKVLPSGYTLAYSGTSYQEKLVAQKGNIVYILSVVFIFLILVALYESWTLPISVLLVVPFAALGSYLGLFVFGLDKNIYLQIGIITLIGLSAKNAILMIEFAEYRIKNLKMSVEDAILEAARIRFRPIMMTSFAFIMGTLALIFSFGAGSGAMHTIGHTVVWGMLFSTMIGTFFIPAFYYAIKKLQMVFKKGQE
jgi:HAE1 family hydrophobic/amphiphilic exporter-1/multidrug efflux pump